MQQFTIRLCEENHPNGCPVCGKAHRRGAGDARGPRLFLEEHADPLCRGCGKKLAPAMAALLDLAHTAERVGRRSRHMLTPPLESLLDLARAAEDYSASAPCVAAHVG
jgi:hypothetical protein